MGCGTPRPRSGGSGSRPTNSVGSGSIRSRSSSAASAGSAMRMRSAITSPRNNSLLAASVRRCGLATRRVCRSGDAQRCRRADVLRQFQTFARREGGGSGHWGVRRAWKNARSKENAIVGVDTAGNGHAIADVNNVIASAWRGHRILGAVAAHQRVSRTNVPEAATGASPKRLGCQCSATPSEPGEVQGVSLTFSPASQSTTAMESRTVSQGAPAWSSRKVPSTLNSTS